MKNSDIYLKKEDVKDTLAFWKIWTMNRPEYLAEYKKVIENEEYKEDKEKCLHFEKIASNVNESLRYYNMGTNSGRATGFLLIVAIFVGIMYFSITGLIQAAQEKNNRLLEEQIERVWRMR